MHGREEREGMRQKLCSGEGQRRWECGKSSQWREECVEKWG